MLKIVKLTMTMKDIVGKETLVRMQSIDWYNKWLFGFIRNHIKSPILEVGAGIGTFTKIICRSGNLYAIDTNPEYIKILTDSSQGRYHAGFGNIENGKVFRTGSRFNTIVCMNVLEHIADDSKAILNMSYLLKKKGKLLLLVPAFMFAFGNLDRKLGHYRRYTTSSVSSILMDCGFHILDSRYLNFIGLFGWIMNTRLLGTYLIPKYQLIIFSALFRPFLMLEKLVKLPLGLSLLIIAEKR